MKSKLLASLLILIVFICTLALGASAATEISSPEQLLELMTGETAANMAGDYILTADIDMSTVTGHSPIGTATYKFSGTFDGDGHTIKGLSIAGGTSNYIGLFGLAQGGTIKNLTVKGTVSGNNYVGGIVGWARGITIDNCHNYVNVTGTGTSGGAAGILGYAVFDTNNNVKVEITDSTNHGTIVGNRYSGGIVGTTTSASATTGARLTIKGCENHGSVTINTGNCAGGIIGYARHNATTGTSYFTIKQCANYGDISYTASSYGYVGGIAGAILDNASANSYPVVVEMTELYNSGAVTGGSRRGGIVSDIRIPKVTDGATTLTVNDWVVVGDTSIPMIVTFSNPGVANAFTVSNFANMTGGAIFSSSTPQGNDVYVISTNNTVTLTNYVKKSATLADQLAFAKAADGIYLDETAGALKLEHFLELDTTIGSPEELELLMATSSAWDKDYTLACDIDMTGYTQSSIGATKTTAFTGSFDGKGYAITGLNISNTAQGGGLFAWTHDATISNLTVKGTVTSTNSRAGGLVGSAIGDLTITGCTVDVDVTASGGASGGVVGTIDCGTEKGTVKITNTTSAGTVSGIKFMGGIIGYVLGAYDTSITVTGCKNTGSVTGTSGAGTGGILGYMVPSNAVTYTFKNCENTGAITGTQYVGGIVGEVYSPTAGDRNNLTFVIDGCTNRGAVSTTTGNVAGGIFGFYINTTSTGTNAITIKNSANYGKVTASTERTTSNGTYAGGIVGAIGGSTANSCTLATVTISNVANYGVVDGRAYAGNIAGTLRPSNGTAYVLEDIYGSENAAYALVGEFGQNADADNLSTLSVSGAYGAGHGSLVATLNSNTVTKANCNTSSSSIISLYNLTANDAQWVMTYDGPRLSSHLNGSIAVDYSIDSADDIVNLMNAPYAWGGGDFTLTNSISLSGKTQSPIGTGGDFKFHGNFDGGNFTISDVNISYTAMGAGLFGTVQHGTIKNLTVKGTITTTQSRAGGIIGAARAPFTIENCTSEVTINAEKYGAHGGIIGTYALYDRDETLTIKNCTSKTVINGTAYNGGILGYMLAGASVPQNLVITGCTNSGKINGTGSGNGGIVGTLIPSSGCTISITNCTNTATVTGNNYTGGILGYVVDDASHGLAESVTYTISGCENTGAVTSTGGNGTGGIAGLLTLYSNSAITVSNCTNSGKISGPAYNGGIVAYISNLASDKEVNGVTYKITGCINNGAVETTTGNVAAGILGYYANASGGTTDNTLTVEKSANYGAITAKGGEGQYAAGCVGAIGSGNNVARVNVTLSQLYNASSAISATDYRGGIVGALRVLKSGSYTINDICGEGVDYGLICTIGHENLASAEYRITRAHNVIGTNIVSDHGGNTITGVNAVTSLSPASYLVTLAGNSNWVMTLDGPKLKLFTDEADIIDTSKVYTISTADELVEVMNHSAIWSLDFALAKSIDLTGKTQSPIGLYSSEGRNFTGTFDGKGYTISGISMSGAQGVGLFGVVQGSTGDHAVIKDLKVSGNVAGTSGRVGGLVAVACGSVEITGCTSGITVSAADGAAGGIVGVVSVENDYGTLVADDIYIEDCTNNGNVTGTRYNGGIVGYVVGSVPDSSVVITKCTNNGTITNTSGNCAAGIMGYYHNTATSGTNVLEITHCGNYGAITGQSTSLYIAGILGAIPHHEADVCVVDATVSDVYNCGAITGKASNCGSIVGLIAPLADGSYTFKNWGDEGTSALSLLGEIKTTSQSPAPTFSLTNAYTVSGVVTPSTLHGNTFNTTLALNAASSASNKATLASEEAWVMTTSGPMLEEFTTAADFEVDYSIDSVEDYLIITNAPESWGGDFTLEANLDLAGSATTPIGNSDTAFTGTFDGKNHTISGLNIVGTEAGTGFFGIVSDDGNTTTIKNFTIKGEVTCAEHRFVGGFVGIVCGATELDGLVNYTTVTSGYFGANAGRIGGIVGGFVNNNLVPAINDIDNDGDYGLTIKNCVNHGKVEGKINTAYEYSDEYNTTPTVFIRHSQARVGGIIGSITPAYQSATNKGSNTILVENCKNYGQIDGVVAVGGIAGVAESSKATNNITITKCSNYGAVTSNYAGGSDIWFGTWTGGIVGYANLNEFGAQYVDNFEISYCYNEGEVCAPYAYLIDSAAAQPFVDEDDVVTDGEGVTDGSTDDTTATSSIEQRAQIGGIVGYAYGGYGDHIVTIQSCYNAGHIWANGNDVAGILGISNAAYVFDCYNTGLVESTYINTKVDGGIIYGRYVGGIIGRLANEGNKFERNFNKGETVSTGGRGYFGVGGGYNAYPDFYSNNFYYNSNTITDKNSTKIAEAQLSDYSVFTGINESTEWLYTLYGPELVYFHDCENTEKIVTTEATCTVKEVYNETCRCLETVYETGVIGEINSDNHAFEKSVWAETDVAGTYEFKCADCGKVMATDETPYVYVDAYAFISDVIGDDENDGVTPETAVYTIEEAVRRLATTGGKIILCDRYVINSDIILPEYEKLITITTKLTDAGKVNTGFAITAQGPHIDLGGPTKFENIIFNGSSKTQNGSDNGYYRIPVICANWHDLEFGDGILSYGAAYVVAGNSYDEKHPLTSATNGTPATVNLTFGKVTAYDIDDGAGTHLQDAVTFFGRVYLGDRVRDVATNPSYTVANKTVVATFNRTTVTDIYLATTSTEEINAQMNGCSVTVNFNEDAYIRYLHTGDGNTDRSGNGTAYLDKATVNVNDNARIFGSWSFENIRDLTLNISAEEDGRSNDYGIAANLKVTKSAGYIALGTEKATVTYGSHSFKKGTAAPFYDTMYALTETVKDDCDWGEAVLDIAASAYVETCSYCGATRSTPVESVEGLTVVYGSSVYLGNDFDLEYPVKVDAAIAATIEECWLKFEHYKEGSEEPVTVVLTPTAEVSDNYTVYRFAAPNIAAKEMNDRIVVTFYAMIDGTLNEAIQSERNLITYYNLAYNAYYEAAEAGKGQAPLFMNLMYAMLNYGAAAQTHFGYNTDALANSVLPEGKAKSEYTATATDVVTSKVNDCDNESYVINEFYPILENKVVMALVFQCTGTAYTADELVFKGSYTDVYGTERTFTVSGDKIDVSDSGVTVDVDAVWAKDLRQMITGALYLTDGTQVSDSVEFSFECYANLVFNDSAAADNLKNVCAAILEYSDAAKALFCDDTDYSAQ